MIITLLVSAPLSGCVMMNSHPVEVKLESLEFVKANPFEQRFKLNINIKNSQSKKLFVRTLDYKVLLNGIEISTGEEPIWQDIPAFSTQQFDILVSTNIWGELKPIINSIKDTREINYYLTGNLVTGSLFNQRISYVRHSGTLTPDQLPMKKIQRLQKLAPALNF